MPARHTLPPQSLVVAREWTDRRVPVHGQLWPWLEWVREEEAPAHRAPENEDSDSSQREGGSRWNC